MGWTHCLVQSPVFGQEHAIRVDYQALRGMQSEVAYHGRDVLDTRVRDCCLENAVEFDAEHGAAGDISARVEIVHIRRRCKIEDQMAGSVLDWEAAGLDTGRSYGMPGGRYGGAATQ